MRRCEPSSLLFQEPDISFKFLNDIEDKPVLFSNLINEEREVKDAYNQTINWDREANVSIFDDPFRLNEELDDTQHLGHDQKQEDIEDYIFPKAYDDDVCSRSSASLDRYDLHTAKTWEQFFSDVYNLEGCDDKDRFNINQRNFKLQTQLLSEQSSHNFEAVIRSYGRDAEVNSLSTLITINQLITCVYYVVIGRESPLFRFDRSKMRFFPTSKYRIIGCTQEIVDEIMHFFSQCGSRLKRLKYTSEVILNEGGTRNSVLYAFSNCIKRVIYRLEKFALKAFSYDQNPQRYLLLKIYNYFQEPAKLVAVLTTIIGCADVQISPRLNRLPDSYRLLNEIYHRTVIFESSDDRLCSLIKLILIRTSSPWLPEVGRLIGIGSKEIFLRNASDIAESDILFLDHDPNTDLLVLNTKKVPIFLQIRLAHLVLETVNCFLVIMRYGSKELQNRVYKLKTELAMKWCMDFSEVLEMNKQIRLYEMLFNSGGMVNSTAEDMTKSDNTDAEYSNLFGSPSNIDSRLQSMMEELRMEHDHDTIEEMVDNTLLDGTNETNRHDVPMEIVAQLSFSPIIIAQWRIANHLVMDVFVGKESIIDHTKLIQQTYFLANGEFVIKLEDIIFGNKGRGGLGLDNNGTHWPPSPIEINGCLSGIIEDITSRLHGVCEEVQNGRFINFGYPNESAEVSGIHSTDVFRLSYNVPRPLSLIFNSDALQHLDLIFQRLMMGLRLSYRLKKKLKSFSYYIGNKELRHFIDCSARYMNFVIEVKWEEGLLKILNTLNIQTNDNSLQRIISLFQTTIEDVSYHLFTRGRERGLLNTIYSYALKTDFDRNDGDKLHQVILEFIAHLKSVQRVNGTHELLFDYFLDQLMFNGYYT